MKKVKALLACCLLASLVAVGVQRISCSAPQNEAFAGINYYVEHGGGSANWRGRASVTTKASSVVASACMKMALIGSGAGPVGTVLAVAAVSL